MWLPIYCVLYITYRAFFPVNRWKYYISCGMVSCLVLAGGFSVARGCAQCGEPGRVGLTYRGNWEAVVVGHLVSSDGVEHWFRESSSSVDSALRLPFRSARSARWKIFDGGVDFSPGIQRQWRVL